MRNINVLKENCKKKAERLRWSMGGERGGINSIINTQHNKLSKLSRTFISDALVDTGHWTHVQRICGSS